MLWEKFVCVKPGQTIRTSMPSFANSARKASLNPCTANLLAEYSLRAGIPRLPAMDEIFRIAGLFPFLSIGKNTRVVSVRPKKIHLHDLPQPFGTDIGKMPRRPDAGVIDEDIQAAKGFLGCFDQFA